MDKLNFILELEEVISEGIKSIGSKLNVSYDGDNKSGEICIDNGVYEVWISTSGVMDYEDY